VASYGLQADAYGAISSADLIDQLFDLRVGRYLNVYTSEALRWSDQCTLIDRGPFATSCGPMSGFGGQLHDAITRSAAAHAEWRGVQIRKTRSGRTRSVALLLDPRTVAASISKGG
jgi:hypothetical protein